jgi:TorA maturation chaperone TorD
MSQQLATHTVIADDVDSILALSDLCLFLSSAFRLPTQTLVDSLNDGSLVVSLNDLFGVFASCKEDSEACEDFITFAEIFALSNISLSNLRHAYTSLFTHPERPLIPPYESLFLYWEKNPGGRYEGAPHLFVCPAALDAERIYKKAGFTRSLAYNESADHISTQMEFVSRLLTEKAQLLSKQAIQEAAAVDNLLAEFSRYHLEKWGERFFDKLKVESIQGTQVYQFYAMVGDLGKTAIRKIFLDQKNHT